METCLDGGRVGNMEGWMEKDGWRVGWLDGWMAGEVDGGMNGQRHGGLVEWMGSWMDRGRLVGCMETWMDGEG